MLDELKFVGSAVSKKGFNADLSCFKIEDGTVRSYNGSLALSSSIQFDIDCIPQAVPFAKAIARCKETVKMQMAKNGKLYISSGKFKAYITCITEDTSAHVEPEGEFYDIDGEALIGALKRVLPFVGNDASRPWSNGVLLQAQSLFATNNVCIVECWAGANFPLTCNIPLEAVKVLLKLKLFPNRIQATDTSISFHFETGQWVRSQLLSTKWPNITGLLNSETDQKPIPEGLFEAVESIADFVDDFGRIYFGNGEVRSSIVSGEGASYKLDDLPSAGIYQADMLQLLDGVATSIDFETYPSPCLFFGDKIRGAIVGMHN